MLGCVYVYMFIGLCLQAVYKHRKRIGKQKHEKLAFKQLQNGYGRQSDPKRNNWNGAYVGHVRLHGTVERLSGEGKAWRSPKRPKPPKFTRNQEFPGPMEIRPFL